MCGTLELSKNVLDHFNSFKKIIGDLTHPAYTEPLDPNFVSWGGEKKKKSTPKRFKCKWLPTLLTVEHKGTTRKLWRSSTDDSMPCHAIKRIVKAADGSRLHEQLRAHAKALGGGVSPLPKRIASIHRPPCSLFF